jgi:hypothetical protein
MMSEVRKGIRVRLAPEAKARYTLDIDTQIDLGRSMLIPRDEGTVRSPRPVVLKRPYEEGIVVYVMWHGLRSPEAWHLTDLEIAGASPEAETPAASVETPPERPNG